MIAIRLFALTFDIVFLWQHCTIWTYLSSFCTYPVFETLEEQYTTLTTITLNFLASDNGDCT